MATYSNTYSNSTHRNAGTQTELQRMQKVASLLDDAFVVPGLGWRFGIDGIVGLIPGFGDFAGLMMSLYIMWGGARLNVSKVVLTRMALNVLIEAVIGSIPFVGDLFDFAWKANRKNMRLIEESLRNPSVTKKKSMGFLVVLASVLVIAIAGLVWLAFQAVAWLWTNLGPGTGW